MRKLLMIKYGELTTKKGNRNFFIKTLSNNIKNKLSGLEIEITSDPSRMYIEFSADDEELILSKISQVFGIHEYIIADKVERSEEAIATKILELIENEDFNTFKIVSKRSDKTFSKTSVELSAKMGGVVLKHKDCKVDVNNPDLTIYIEVRQDASYVYTNARRGLGGYPVGAGGKGLLLLSGGIDSPVAGYLALKRGVSLEAIYFESLPHTSLQAREKVITLGRKLSAYGSEIKLHIIPFTELQEAIYSKMDPSYGVTIMRRMMYRIATRLAKKRKANAIITGESIGQVASQTLTSMRVINDVTKMPIIRPVACLDKLEIIDISKKIDSYETSILPFDDCCSLFLPKHPVINPNVHKCEEYEALIDYEDMINTAINGKITIMLNEKENRHEELL